MISGWDVRVVGGVVVAESVGRSQLKLTGAVKPQHLPQLQRARGGFRSEGGWVLFWSLCLCLYDIIRCAHAQWTVDQQVHLLCAVIFGCIVKATATADCAT
jgi:hypothetical protein